MGLNFSAWDNYRYLGEKISGNIKYVWDISEADYFISNFRRQPEFQKYKNGEYPYTNKFFSIEVDGNEILVVYRLK